MYKAFIFFVFRQWTHDCQPPAIVAYAQTWAVRDFIQNAFVLVPIYMLQPESGATRQPFYNTEIICGFSSHSYSDLTGIIAGIGLKSVNENYLRHLLTSFLPLLFGPVPILAGTARS